MQCFHSLDSAKCLLSLDVSCPRCPHAVKMYIPEDWDAGMYSLVLSGAEDRGDGSCRWKAWRGILVVKPRDVEAKSICGAQALPASARPLEAPPPPRADASRTSSYSLCIIVDPVAHPNVIRYRLMQRRACDDAASSAEAGGGGRLPNGAPAADFKEVAEFLVSAKKGARKDFHKQVHDLVPGERYGFVVIAETEDKSVCSEEAELCCHSTPPHTPSPPTLAKRDKRELKLKWLAPDNCGAAIMGYEVAMALEAERASDIDFDESEAEVRYAMPGGQQPMPLCYAGSDTGVLLKSLLPGARYVFRVRASNAEGWSEWSRLAHLCTAPAVPDPPPPPTATIEREQKEDGAATVNIRVTWSAPEKDNGAAISEYMLEHDGGEGSTGSFRAAFRGLALAHVVTNVPPASSHRFRLKALNAAGASELSGTVTVCAPSEPPTPPQRLTAQEKVMTVFRDLADLPLCMMGAVAVPCTLPDCVGGGCAGQEQGCHLEVACAFRGQRQHRHCL